MTPNLCFIPKMPMKLDVGLTEIKIDVLFAATVTLTLISDQSGIGAMALLCCAVHEAGHIICLLALGEKPRSVVLSFYGIKLERSGICQSRAREAAIYVSGPTVNFLLATAMLFLREKGRMLALLSFFAGAFNMMPCRPLDGGNVLWLFLCARMSENRADKISFAVSCIVLVPLAASGMAVLLRSGNISLFAVSVYLAGVIFSDKKEKSQIKL